MKRISFLDSSHCAACFTGGGKSEEKYFGRFLVKFDNMKLESSAVMPCGRRKYVEIEKRVIQYSDIRAHKYA